MLHTWVLYFEFFRSRKGWQNLFQKHEIPVRKKTHFFSKIILVPMSYITFFENLAGLLSRVRNGDGKLIFRKRVCATAVAHRWGKKEAIIFIVFPTHQARNWNLWDFWGAIFINIPLVFIVFLFILYGPDCSPEGPKNRDNYWRKLQKTYKTLKIYENDAASKGPSPKDHIFYQILGCLDLAHTFSSLGA